MSAERPYPDEFLLKYSAEHLAYEVQMFFGLITACGEATLACDSRSLSKFIRNAILESKVLHFRNLVEFLYADTPRPTDVVADDYVRECCWAIVRQQISYTLDSARQRANKEMAHLTSERKGPYDDSKKWDIPALRDEVRPILQRFIDHADPELLSPQVARNLKL